MVAIASLAWAAFGMTGFLYAAAIESFLTLIFIGQFSTMGADFVRFGAVVAVAAIIILAMSMTSLIEQNGSKPKVAPDTSQTPIFQQFGGAV